MSNDPVQHLRNELVAAHRRASAQAEHATNRRRRRPRRQAALAVAGLALAGTSAAAVAGVTPFGSGATPDGSTYTTDRFVATTPQAGLADPPAGAACQRTSFRDRSGAITTTSTACKTAGSAPTRPREALEVGFTVAPGDSLLIQGTVADEVVRVTVSGVSEPIGLVQDDNGRRAFSTLTTEHHPVVHAFDRRGREVAVYALPL
jgi:hypothetical protein